MNAHTFRLILLVTGLSLAAGSPASAQTKKGAAKPGAAVSAAPASHPKIDVAVDSVLDRRSTGTCPSPSLTLMLALPSSVALAILAVPLICTLFYYGQFNVTDVLMTRQALMSYAWWSSPAGEAAERRWIAFMQK